MSSYSNRNNNHNGQPHPTYRSANPKASDASGRAPVDDAKPKADQNHASPVARPQTHAEQHDAGQAHRAQGKGSGSRDRRHNRLVPLALAVAAVVAVAAAIVWQFVKPITVNVNGTDVQITDRTVQAAFEAAGEPAEAGDLYDIEGELLEEGGGEEIVVTVNDEIAEFDDTVHEDDVLLFFDGDDVEEASYILEDQELEPEVIEEGTGPIYTVAQEGVAGVCTVQVGEVSGKQIVIEVEQEATPWIYERWTPDVGDDKVIALTFDDGPSTEYTEQILDILAEYDVKATFFTIGEQIEGEGAELVLREYEEGHQVCTHTWDHASGDGNGVNLSYMTEEDQREEVSKGIQAIADATGVEASTVIRAPGGNFPIEVWENVQDLISAQVIWTVDTEDWSEPGTEAIVASIEGASSGDIILLHDGGGDRSETVAALEEALPYLIDEGYTFVTIDELMEYPAVETEEE